MTPEAAQALEASIQHWRENVAEPERATTGPADCALCVKFHPDFGGQNQIRDCDGCPVRDFTGVGGCCATPFEDAHSAYYQWWADYDNKEKRSAFVAAAQAELDFLVSLREPTP